MRSTGDPGCASSKGDSLPSLSFKLVPPCTEGVFLRASLWLATPGTSATGESMEAVDAIGTIGLLAIGDDVACRPHKGLCVFSSIVSLTG